MARAIVSFTNLVDSAVLSASSAAGDLSVSNLADPIIQRPWRSSGANDWCQADFGSSQSIGVVGLAIPRSGLVLAATDTIRLQLDNTTPGTGAIYDSGAVASGIVASFGTWLTFFAAPLSARYLRLTIVTANAYIQLGRLWAGAYLQPNPNIGFGWGREWSDGATIVKAPKSGVRFRNPGPRFRTLTIAWNFLNAADAAAIEDGDIIAGLSGQLLACTDPAAPARTTIIGTPKQTAPVLQPNYSTFSKAAVIEEDL